MWFPLQRNQPDVQQQRSDRHFGGEILISLNPEHRKSLHRTICGNCGGNCLGVFQNGTLLSARGHRGPDS